MCSYDSEQHYFFIHFIKLYILCFIKYLLCTCLVSQMFQMWFTRSPLIKRFFNFCTFLTYFYQIWLLWFSELSISVMFFFPPRYVQKYLFFLNINYENTNILVWTGWMQCMTKNWMEFWLMKWVLEKLFKPSLYLPT